MGRDLGNCCNMVKRRKTQLGSNSSGRRDVMLQARFIYTYMNLGYKVEGRKYVCEEYMEPR